uniref:Uncharacterized protein n=1 Tax=Arundo donax TaxID=35708 RepID=A0A0A9E8X8_ARUDO
MTTFSQPYWSAKYICTSADKQTKQIVTKRHRLAHPAGTRQLPSGQTCKSRMMTQGANTRLRISY